LGATSAKQISRDHFVDEPPRFARESRRTGDFGLWHPKLESTVRYLGIEVDDALEIAEQTEV
jgi:hypothetical protein